MIDPNTITNFNRSEAELEEFLLFAILVAGKSAKQQAKKLDDFLYQQRLTNDASINGWTPFQEIEHLWKNNLLLDRMAHFRLGQYKRLETAFKGILDFKGRLSTITIEELESVKGIGSKTARFFVLHSRPNQNIAVLDTHILKWLKFLGYDAPKATPSKKNYGEVERWFLMEANNRKMTPANLDLQVWKEYAQMKKHHPELV
jgi:thermostable 8-oxoguanine DNA glycosylase